MPISLNPPVVRAAVYVIYDEQGVIDDYIPYQLSDLKRNLSFLLVVVNGFLSEAGRRKLAPLADHIIVRENKGFDAEALKAGLEYAGWDALSQYDELLLMNDTCFGPLYPFKAVFDEMNARDCDFWALNGCPLRPARRGWKPPRYGFVPAHLCSNFICLRKTILQSPHFKAYWKALPPIKSFKDAVVKHEFLFTKYFEDRGFVSGKFVSEDDLYEATDYPLILMAKELAANRKCPVFKKKSFTHFDEFCAVSSRDATRALYEYVRDNTGYDVDLIWRNILRVGNLAEIKNALHLNYVLPKGRLVREPVRREVALFFDFHHLDATEDAMRYINRMPDYAHVYVTTDTEEKKEALARELEKTSRRYMARLTGERGVSALLDAFREYALQYEAACFASDRRRGGVFPLGGMENVLGSEAFIENALGAFEAEKRLGVLSPPPNHEPCKEYLGNEWGDSFRLTKRLLEALGIEVPLDEAKPPVAAFGPYVWFRPKALARLFETDWKCGDFFRDAPSKTPPSPESLNQAIERSLGY
ncbi:MAG: rhamnan synthesis F family protein, partial [Treponema sp.]|nr:rhamnan synthesis F family protein [Treponema sp.]